MKKIFLFLLLIIAINVNAQETTVPTQGVIVTGSANILHDNIKIDTTKLVKKILSQEIVLPQSMDILVDMTGSVIVKVWSESKVKIETTIRFQDANELTDEQWLEKAGISVKKFGSTIRVKSKQTGSYSFNNTFSNSIYGFRNAQEGVYSGKGYFLGSVPNERHAILYVPANSRLEIENNFGHLKIDDNLRSLALISKNGDVDVANIDELELRSTAGSFSAGVISNGDIEIAHGRLSLKELKKGFLAGNYNTIEIEKLGEVKLNSSIDDIDIDEATSLSGTKNYGNLQINKSGNIDLKGMGATIKLRKLDPSANTIRIFNSNADLRLPLRDLKNYSIEVKGGYNRIYETFDDKLKVDTLTANEVNEIMMQAKTIAESSNNGVGLGMAGNALLIGVTNSYIPAQMPAPTKAGSGISVTTNSIERRPNRSVKQTLKVGDGNQVKVDIVCSNCTLDFK